MRYNNLNNYILFIILNIGIPKSEEYCILYCWQITRQNKEILKTKNECLVLSLFHGCNRKLMMLYVKNNKTKIKIIKIDEEVNNIVKFFNSHRWKIGKKVEKIV